MQKTSLVNRVSLFVFGLRLRNDESLSKLASCCNMYLGLERELHLKVEEYLPAKTQIKVVDQQGLWVQKET